MRSRLSSPFLLLVATMLATLAVYWIGLQGPFLFDDTSNLRSIPDWLAGRLSLGTLLFERGAGTFGRPLSMASFAFNAWLGGYTPYALKVGNLLTHLACGGILFGFLRQLLRRDPHMSGNAGRWAAVVTALWLLHPLHASTVLYVVQRMAQLSTLLILCGLWAYLTMRERLERGPSPAAAAGLLVGIPVFTLLAFLGKENGILLPLLCGVIEIAWFRAPRPWPARTFQAAYLYLPAALAALLFWWNPQRFLGGYIRRDFDVYERLLSQGRALCDYLWKLVVPDTPRMGIYTDDFPLSTSLLQPPSTLFALLFLLVASVAAWRVRQSLPAVFFGWFFFLAAHLLESSIIPLELYFEHRNYLPSVGILLALVSLVCAAGAALARREIRVGRIGAVLLFGVLVVLAWGTQGRAQIWRSAALIAESSLLAHPDSLRANASTFGAAVSRGDRTRAEKVIETLTHSSLPRNRAMGHVYRLFLDCASTQQGDPRDLDAFVSITPMPLTLTEAQPFNTIYEASAEGCGAITDQHFGAALAKLADRAHAQSDLSSPKWRLRYQSACFYVRAKDWKAALPQARLAWQVNAEPVIGIPLAMAQLATGDLRGAEKTYAEARSRSDPSNAWEKKRLDWLEDQIAFVRKRLANHSP